MRKTAPRSSLTYHAGTPPPTSIWGHTPSGTLPDRSCLRQWFLARFVIDGITYATAEHFMMAQKARMFENQAALQALAATPDPKVA